MESIHTAYVPVRRSVRVDHDCGTAKDKTQMKKKINENGCREPDSSIWNREKQWMREVCRAVESKQEDDWSCAQRCSAYKFPPFLVLSQPHAEHSVTARFPLSTRCWCSATDAKWHLWESDSVETSSAEKLQNKVHWLESSSAADSWINCFFKNVINK